MFYRLGFAFLLIALYSCSAPPEQVNISSESTNGFVPEYARGFQVISSENPIHILIFNPSDPMDTLDEIILEKPVSRIACMSTTHLSMLDKLRELSKVKAVGYGRLVRNTAARARIENGQILNLTTGDEIDREILIAAAPEIFLMYPFGQTDCAIYASLHIRCVPVLEYLEEHPLGRAEWIRMVGILTGCTARADSLFLSIKKKYLDAEAMVEKVKLPDKPVVFFSSKEKDRWYAPPGNSAISHLIADAGGSYLFADSLSSGNISLSFEKLIDTAFDADYWGYITFSSGAFTLSQAKADDQRLAVIPAYRHGNIFYCNAAAKDYFGDALLEPDILLKDMIKILHPDLLPHYLPHYFERLE